MNLSYTGKLIKKQGKLVYYKAGQEKIYQELVKNIPEGAIVDVFMEVHSNDGTLSQLAKAHAMLRSISIHTGMTVEELKLLIKHNCGFCFIHKIKDKEYLECKSLADLSKEELGLFIEECYRQGEEVGLRLQ